MTKWKMTLDLTDKWDAVCEEESLVPDFCQTIAERLETLLKEQTGLVPGDKRGLRQYADEFRALGDDADFNSFNDLWGYFYDWADSGKRLWVKLF
jgi:hypothetical protein